MTPQELSLILERWHERGRREDYRAAVAPTIFANIHRRPHSQPAEPADFFPSLRAEAMRNAPHEQTPEQQLDMFRRLMGGRIRELAEPATQQPTIDVTA